MMAVVNEGDEVIYPNPGFPIYESVINFLGAKPVPLALKEEKEFRFDLADLEALILKHKAEKFLFPCSNIRSNDIPNLMNRNDLHLTEAIMYETVPSDLSDLTEVFYDIICFYSPSGITSLISNFPDWKQNNTRLAAFGPTTAKAIRDAEFILDIEAPLPNAPSMTGALELYIRKANNI